MEENTNTETLVRRLLSTDYADKVIVTTIQKLGLALDGTYKKNYKERLESLSGSDYPNLPEKDMWNQAFVSNDKNWIAKRSRLWQF